MIKGNSPIINITNEPIILKIILAPPLNPILAFCKYYATSVKGL
jgi:hypothetical protein